MPLAGIRKSFMVAGDQEPTPYMQAIKMSTAEGKNVARMNQIGKLLTDHHEKYKLREAESKVQAAAEVAGA